MAIIDRLLGLDKKSFELEDPHEYDKSSKYDCVSCRVFGATALTATGAYVYYSGMQQIRLRHNIIEKSRSKYKTGSRQLGIITLSGTLVGLGIYRMFN